MSVSADRRVQAVARHSHDAGCATEVVPAVEAIGLTKRYGNRLALRDVDLEVRAGECLAVFGANGAGKSTLLRVLSTLTRPTAGVVRCCGFDLLRQAGEVRKLVGVVAHQTYLYDELTVWENMDFYARLYDVEHRAERIMAALEVVGLSERAHERVRHLSRGLQQRLALARAIVHRPRVLLLDEPDTGLDREGQERLARIVAEQLDGGGTVLLTTHAVEFGCRVASRGVLLRGGRVEWDRPIGDAVAAALERALRGS